VKRYLSAAAFAASLVLSSLAFAQTPAPPAHPAVSGSNVGFPSEAAAKAACPTDTIAWANPSSKVLHAAGTKYYGKTARGSYMCQTQALGAGYHLSGTKKGG